MLIQEIHRATTRPSFPIFFCLRSAIRVACGKECGEKKKGVGTMQERAPCCKVNYKGEGYLPIE